MIGYAGLSHLGLISALAAAAKGFPTVGFDPDRALVEAIASARLPVSEPGLDDLFASVAERVRFSCDPGVLAACSVVYVAKDVPTDPDGRSDLASVLNLVEVVVQATRPGTTIVILSQVHPGFTRQLGPIVEGGGRRLFYQVETLIFGRAVERALEPERFIVGCADPGAPLPADLAHFLGAFGCPILPMRLESAELTKIAINMFLVSSVSTTNMLAELCEHIGADWREIAPALRLDRRIGPHAYLAPGLGIGGSNLGRDMATVQRLAAEHGTDVGIVRAWQDNSRYRRDWALRTLHRELDGTDDPVLAVWGLTYKENTHSTINSPAVELVVALGRCRIRAYDPVVGVPREIERPGLSQEASPLEACDGADALVVMTPWPAFASVPIDEVARRLRGHLVIDPFGIIPSAEGAAAGLQVRQLGSTATPQRTSQTHADVALR
jgi:UDPglucose 6-dehydrogenase